MDLGLGGVRNQVVGLIRVVRGRTRSEGFVAVEEGVGGEV